MHLFVKHIKEVKLEPGEVMTSYDVKVLFTSVPVDPAIQEDPLLPQRTDMSVLQIIIILEFGLQKHILPLQK